MPTIEVNKDLAVEAMAVIETHPERWKQSCWKSESGSGVSTIHDFADDPLDPACKTAFCLAGWVGALDHKAWHPTEDSVWTGTSWMPIEDYATARLGLTQREATCLFDPYNSLEMLAAGVKALMNNQDIEDEMNLVKAEQLDSCEHHEPWAQYDIDQDDD